MKTIELFRLFGSILVDNTEANNSISATDTNASRMSETLSGGIKTAASWGLGLAAAAGTAALAIGGLAVNASQDLQKALNGVQSSTGVSTEKMAGMRDAMLDIYSNNFGESFEAIGVAMQSIAQQTKLSGDELANTTKNALMIEDTFGVGVSESIRSANQLIKNFGLSSTEAYNFIAQGAQAGLNANENLADSINEYSVHFAGVGLGATDMFNMLKNGADTGVFDIDKLGDAIKEFGIRSKDSSKGTMEAFTALGLNATQVSNDFANGGEKGKAAFELVTTKLNAMKDPLTQTTVGTALFGTMWEDIGAKGIKALSNTKGGIDKNIDALGKINAVKYDTFGEAMTGIKRQLEVGILIPMGDKILPILNDFAKWIQGNMPKIMDFFDKTLTFTNNKFKILSDTITAAVNPAIKYITEKIIPPLTEIFKELYEKYLPILSDTFNSVFPVVKKIVSDVFTIIVERILPPFLNVLIYIYAELMPKVFEIFNTLVPKISKIWDNLMIALGPIFDALQKTFEIVFPIIKNIVESAIDIIKGVLNGLLKSISGVIEFIAGVLTGDWKKAWNGFKDIFTGIWDTLTSIFDGLDEKLQQIGVDIIKGLWNGISSMSDWIQNKIDGFSEALGQKFKDYFGIASPSKLMAEYGTNIVEGLGEGIEKNISIAIDSMNKLGEAVINALKTKYEKQRDIRIKAIQKEHDDLKNALEKERQVNVSAYDKMTSDLTRHTDKKIREYDREYEAKFKILDSETQEKIRIVNKQINDLDAKTEEEEKIIKDSEYQKRLVEKKSQIEILKQKEGSGKEIQTLLTEIEESETERKRQLLLEQRNEQKESLRQEIENTITNADIKRKEMEKELLVKKNHLELDRDMELQSIQRDKEDTQKAFDEEILTLESNNIKKLEKEKQYYEGLLKEQNLQAEARKLALNKDNKELITLLEEYNPKWQDAGQSFGESMIKGLNSKKQEIKDVVKEIMSLVNKVGSSTVSSISNFGGARANGGSVNSGQTYLVGERGAELFTPNTNGSIIPNNKLSSNANIIINITGNSLMGDNDADKLGEILVGKLRTLGVTP